MILLVLVLCLRVIDCYTSNTISVKTRRKIFSHNQEPEYFQLKSLKKLYSMRAIGATISFLGMLRTKVAAVDSTFYEKWPYRNPRDIMFFIENNSIEGDFRSVALAMDIFAEAYPMYKLSSKKADLLAREVKLFKPQNILEIGTFFGYSALYLASAMPSDCHLTCIESNSENINVANQILVRAFGMDSDVLKRVRIVNGISTDVISASNIFEEKKIDFVFLDHDKDSYLKDLKILEEKNILGRRCHLVADNVIYPGSPGYLEYVGYPATHKDDISAEAKSWVWKTRVEKMPFERVGFETKFMEVEDAMAISDLLTSTTSK